MNKPLFEVKQLEKVFTNPKRKTLFSHINLSLQAGRTVAIIGPSGCGKTTLLHILATLEKPSSGSLYFQGKPLSDYNPYTLRNKHLGFVFQNFNLIESLSVLDNILIPSLIAGNRVGAKAKARSLLETLGLSGADNKPAYHLSGGEKQRVAIARALINNPDLILADEPTGNLDEATSINLFNLLIGQTKEQNKALLLVTHSSELALLCDKIYTLTPNGLIEASKECV